MKQTWQRFAAKIDGLALRERVIIFIAALLVMMGIVNSLVLGSQFDKETALSQQIAQDQSQIAGIQADIHSRIAAYSHDPDAVKKAQLNLLHLKSDQMRVDMQNMQKGLVAPDRMTALLQDILKQNGKLHLVSLRTLPATGLNEPDPADKPASAAAAATSAAAPAAAGKPATPAAAQPVSAPAGAQVYKHGVEIVIEGNYLDMVDYMTALEKMPWQLFWGKAKLTADESSKLSLTLTLYTLSLDKNWLNI